MLVCPQSPAPSPSVPRMEKLSCPPTCQIKSPPSASVQLQASLPGAKKTKTQRVGEGHYSCPLAQPGQQPALREDKVSHREDKAASM